MGERTHRSAPAFSTTIACVSRWVCEPHAIYSQLGRADLKWGTLGRWSWLEVSSQTPPPMDFKVTSLWWQAKKGIKTDSKVHVRERKKKKRWEHLNQFAERHVLPSIKMHYKATIIKPVCYWHKARRTNRWGEIDIVSNKSLWEMKEHTSIEEGWIIQ